MKKPLIIHLSGTSGAGKSHIGAKVKAAVRQTINEEDLVVKDTDEFLQPATASGKHLRTLTHLPDDEFAAEWQRIVAAEIGQFLDAHRTAAVVLFVGLLNNGSRSDACAFVDVADTKIFLDVPREILLFQYYNRVCERILESRPYLTNLTTKQQVVASSAQVLANLDYEAAAHCANGYRLLDVKTCVQYLQHVVDSFF